MANGWNISMVDGIFYHFDVDYAPLFPEIEWKHRILNKLD